MLVNNVYRIRINEEVQKIYNWPNINTYLISKRLEWTNIIKKAMREKIDGKRPSGRPRQHRINKIKEYLNKCE